MLVQDWFKDSQSKGRVRSAVEDVLHTNLPDSYDRAVFAEKCDNVFETMLNYASQGVWDPIIGPSGMTFYTGSLFPAWKGSLFIGGHGTRDLVRVVLEGDKVVGEERLLKDIQPKPEPIRDVRTGPDGAIYVMTDSPVGRILKLVPKK